MNTDKLKGKRVERRYTQSDIAKIIERSTDAYAKKERGVTEFTPYQIAVIAKALNLTLSEFDDIFF